MNYSTGWAVGVLAGAGAMLYGAAACGPGGGGTPSCSGLVAGDLVITEIMADPAGADTGKEWFEIYNASGAARDLEGVQLAASKPDGTGEKTHAMGTLMVPAGGYVVLGDVLADTKPAYVDYGYGSDLGGLLNAAGRLTLRCGDVEVDRASYQDVNQGAARALSGATAPDYQFNDDLANWCDATTEYETGSLGTPGEANASCGSIMPPGMCLDAGVMRATVPPAVGDLVISEFMPSPDGTDTTAEWFEVFVANDVDLNGLQIGKTLGNADTTLNSDTGDCLHATAGTYVVFGRSTDPVANAGLPKVDYVYNTAFSTSGSIDLAIGGVAIDDISWASAFTSASSSLDPDSLTSVGNDAANAFCKAVDPYGTLTNKGTPGAANPQCPTVVPTGMCDDAGVVRPIVPPTAGQLVITEFMPDPALAADASAEWFELLVNADVDLNDLQVGNLAPTVKLTLASPTCLHIAAGTRVLFAQTDDMALNGGLPAVNFTFGALSLANTNSGIFVGLGGVVLDAVTYAASTAGKSTQLDPDFTDTVGNDTAANFCPTPDANTYGLGDKGTPAAANVQCP